MFSMLRIPEDADGSARVVEQSARAELHPVRAGDVTMDEAGVVTGVGEVEVTSGQSFRRAGVGHRLWRFGGGHHLWAVIYTRQQ